MTFSLVINTVLGFYSAYLINNQELFLFRVRLVFSAIFPLLSSFHFFLLLVARYISLLRCFTDSFFFLQKLGRFFLVTTKSFITNKIDQIVRPCKVHFYIMFKQATVDDNSATLSARHVLVTREEKDCLRNLSE